ncbi:MAG: hypothetical protein RRZ70_03105 [Synergistaceae bacterium]
MNLEKKQLMNSMGEKIKNNYKDMLERIEVSPKANYENYVDIFVYLYWNVFNLHKNELDFIKLEDYIFISDEELTPLLYAVLAEKGFFPSEELCNFARLGSFLQYLPNVKTTPGINIPLISSVSEFVIASSFAQSMHEKGSSSKVYCVLNNRENTKRIFDEIKRISSIGLSNIVLIVISSKADTNRIKEDEELLSLVENLNWEVSISDNSNLESLESAFVTTSKERSKFVLIKVF